MAKTNDTIKGLLAEFRGYSAGMPASYHVTMSWADFRKMLDRFDAANKREVQNALDAGGFVEASRKNKQVGNAAKLREALENIAVNLEHRLFAKYPSNASDEWMYQKARAALAAPPRNCDRPECATTKAAANVWRKEDGGKTAYHEWLLATATEKEGGTNG